MSPQFRLPSAQQGNEMISNGGGGWGGVTGQGVGGAGLTGEGVGGEGVLGGGQLE